ncbi:MAG TPA: hypothetical protein VHZ55_22705 [Bryobacteraceae bacterium]|nr:hypothetical protein [Bryobacteraceae bacterium]
MPESLSPEDFKTVCDHLRRAGVRLYAEDESWIRLEEMRRLYEPYVATLGRQLRMDLAPWAHPAGVKDNWVVTKWQSGGTVLGH